MAKKIVTYEALGTTWKVHCDLIDSPGLEFVLDYLSGYDLSGLERIEVKRSNWGYRANSAWTNPSAGHCAGPWNTKTRKFLAVCRVNGRSKYPTNKYVTARTPKGKRKVPYLVYSEAESLIAIVAHEVCHYLGYTDQIPKHGESRVYRRRSWNSTDEVETGEFQIRAVEAYRLSNRNVTATDTPPDSDPVTVNDTRCRECGMKLGARQAFCSDRCRWTFHNRQRSQRTAAGRKMKTCEACGKGFVPRRSDARTCSSACRQKLHRLRGQTRARNTG